MARVVLATIGSLGDLHPMIAIGLELSRRNHEVVICTWRGYRDRILSLGLEFRPLRPDVDIRDREMHRRAMDARTGSEFVIKDLILGNIRATYDDLTQAAEGIDILVSGEIVYAAASVAEMTGLKWVSTSLAPVSMFSAHDPAVYRQNSVFELLRPLPVFFHQGMLSLMGVITSGWFDGYRRFRGELGLSTGHDPMFRNKFSPRLHLAMFSRALGKPQPDWPVQTVQTGFCFYDEGESNSLDPAIRAFLDAGPPPIVFTLGSAASLDPGSFFDESVKAATRLGRRALQLYGRDQPRPHGLNEDIAAFDFAPYSLIFPRAACVVHQAGVGTTGQVLRAGVPHVIVPFSHDQPDNAARCRRAGVAEIISRDLYTAESAAAMLEKVLADPRYRSNAATLATILESEGGTSTACDAIEEVLRA
ncbi:MAG: glycosyltransferase [Pyrinomonadaceae bacterium]